MRLYALSLIALLGSSLSACGDANGNGPGNGMPFGDAGLLPPADSGAVTPADSGAISPTDGAAVAPADVTAPAGALSAQQIAALRALREEENLARDVYTAVGAGRMIFTNIAASEQTHTDAVRVLLVRYAIPDPAAGRAPGTFESATFTSLYAALVAQGRASSVAALQVGAEIEELDIKDLREMRALFTQADVLATLDLLEQGSRNHLRAFWRQLQMSGGTYTPRHLDMASFLAIVNSATESGAMGR